MKLHLFYIGVLAAICTVSAANARNYVHGTNNHCWIETSYGSKSTGDTWAYHYCGGSNNYIDSIRKCAGYSTLGHDLMVTNYHGDSFTFKYKNETYWCCGGTKDKEGTYMPGEKWFVKEETVKVPVAGGTCNQLVQTDICGEVHVTECTKPDNCDDGTVLRNNECVATCGGDEVFESTTSNKCIKCKITAFQGPSTDHTACISCDRYTEFYNREDKKCVKRSKLELTEYSKEAMKECWRCPRQLFKICVQAVTSADTAGKTGSSRLSAIESFVTTENPKNITKQCYLTK